jgi:putative AlgH/UPF0301 family transcriptional regulator
MIYALASLLLTATGSTRGFVVPAVASRGRAVVGATMCTSSSSSRSPSHHSILPRNAKSNEDHDDEEEDIDVSDQDWRAFRAKLVMQTKAHDEPTTILQDGDVDGIGSLFSTIPTQQQQQQQQQQTVQGMTPLDPSQWAYDSGKVIEQGAVILGGVEQEFGFGLRQQYFHKAAILVLDHDEKTFTKGIILNRPSDLTLEDDLNQGVKWRVWFGGDVQGLDSNNPDIVCLHSLKTERAVKASIPVMNDIQWTTFDNAKRLVKAGAASPTDFWVFCGYAGWGPQQLMGELDRKSWYMVATDSQTLLQELARQTAGADPRDAGLDTWTLLMNMIGKADTADEYSGDFDDLVLKEWARRHLLSTDAGGGAGKSMVSPAPSTSTPEVLEMNAVDQLLERVTATARGEDVTEGTLVRASSLPRSPFLLDTQEMHKAIVLVISDNENISVGVILNLPSVNGLDVQLIDKTTRSKRTVVIPLRYGGKYAVKGAEPLLWLHASQTLRAAGIGSEVGLDQHNLFKCTKLDVTTAISQGLATPDDFVVVSGVSVWTKGIRGIARGMQGEVQMGRFEVVPRAATQSVWDTLRKQDVLTKLNLKQCLSIGNEAWEKGAKATTTTNTSTSEKQVSMTGIGDNFDEEDDSLVFKSDMKVAELSDKALRSWVATYLLGSPSLGF